MTTAYLYFIVSAIALQGNYSASAIGPFASKAACLEERSRIASVDKGFVGQPFIAKTECVGMNVVTSITQFP